MKNVIHNQIITAQGENLMLTCEYVSGSPAVAVLNTNGTAVPLKTFDASGATVLPGYAGTRYRVTLPAGTMNVHGACTVN